MHDDFFVVGLGASAGGIKAFKEFFEHVPPDSGIAYVVILHLSPEHESILASVLQSSSSIPVTQVQEKIRLQPDHVYVIPPNQSLSLSDGHLLLEPITRIEERRAPVDIFFRTLAESHGPYAACVILSGTGANGSMGMKRVKERGGICLVQDPDEAEFTDMPRNSIATALVDDVLPVAKMPARIISYKNHLRAVRIPDERDESVPSIDEQALNEIFVQLRLRTGHDFSNYRRATVLRRIQRRMGVVHIFELAAYAGFLSEDADEARALLKDLLISVTHFFRDRNAFEALDREVIPRLFEGKGPDSEVRVWVAGCATGEEAYSIAILLAQYASHASGRPAIQVFATDIDQAAIATAREGCYTLNDAADVSPEHLRRFFTKDGNEYRVRQELRELILFANHNIVKDPPFSHLDLISCRNLLIYLNRSAQQRVNDVMHFALNPGGYLFLGSSESVDDGEGLFVPVDKDARLYQRRNVARRHAFPLPDLSAGLSRRLQPAEKRDSAESSLRDRILPADLHLRLLEQYAPPSIVVNERYDIVHLSARAGRYLQLAGEPSHNLLAAIRPELRSSVRSALLRAFEERTNVDAHGLVFSDGDHERAVDIRVRPVLRDTDVAHGCFLILFEERGGDAEQAEPRAATLRTQDPTHYLEEELHEARAQLRTNVTRYESQTEDLRASNEELQAMNEELRSSGEELETGKEELQSLNEELRTVNQELKIKIEEQTAANTDVRNLINSTDIATIFLDRASQIKLFTPNARDLFTLIPTDRGRPLSDVSTTLIDADLNHGVARVLDNLEPIQREVRSRHDRWYLMRIVPYRADQDRVDGVVLTFVDITERKALEEELRRSEERLRLTIESVVEYAIFTIDPDERIMTWNRGAQRMFGYLSEEAVGQPAAIIFTPEDRQQGVPEREVQQARSTGKAVDERWHLRKDGTRLFVSGVLAPLYDASGSALGYVKVARDLTERRQFQHDLQLAHDQLESRVGERTHELTTLNVALERELREGKLSEERVKRVMSRLITVQEQERRRIARDLHDHLGQQMTALQLKFEALRHVLEDNPELHDRAREAQSLLSHLNQDLDFFTWELRPASLYDLGLVPALDDFVRRWSKSYDIAAEFEASGLDSQRLLPELEINLYRIAQEALNNTYKHAKATHVDMWLQHRDGHMILTIEDNGVGFDPDPVLAGPNDRGMGVAGMRERAALIGGMLELETPERGGTTVIVRVPAVFVENAYNKTDVAGR